MSGFFWITTIDGITSPRGRQELCFEKARTHSLTIGMTIQRLAKRPKVLEWARIKTIITGPSDIPLSGNLAMLAHILLNLTVQMMNQSNMLKQLNQAHRIADQQERLEPDVCCTMGSWAFKNETGLLLIRNIDISSTKYVFGIGTASVYIQYDG